MLSYTPNSWSSDGYLLCPRSSETTAAAVVAVAGFIFHLSRLEEQEDRTQITGSTINLHWVMCIQSRCVGKAKNCS